MNTYQSPSAFAKTLIGKYGMKKALFVAQSLLKLHMHDLWYEDVVIFVMLAKAGKTVQTKENPYAGM